MPGRQAKVLTRAELNGLLASARRTPYAERNCAVVLLAVLAGLRACEIARLTWPMITTPNGRLSPLMEIRDEIAKYGSGRRVPIHAELKQALTALAGLRDREGYVIRSLRGGPLRSNSIVQLFGALARQAGLKGCSSHSGRRTFITRAARMAHKAGANLRDIQILAGHRSIVTTQGYIDGDSDAQRSLVLMLKL
jgi:integrase